MTGNWWRGFTFIIQKMKTNDLKQTIMDADKIKKNNKLLAQFLELAIVEERADLSLELKGIIDLSLLDEGQKLAENFVLEVKNGLAYNPSFILAIKKYEEISKILSQAIDEQNFLLANNLKRKELDFQKKFLSLSGKILS